MKRLFFVFIGAIVAFIIFERFYLAVPTEAGFSYKSPVIKSQESSFGFSHALYEYNAEYHYLNIEHLQHFLKVFGTDHAFGEWLLSFEKIHEDTKLTVQRVKILSLQTFQYIILGERYGGQYSFLLYVSYNKEDNCVAIKSYDDAKVITHFFDSGDISWFLSDVKLWTKDSQASKL